MVKKYNMETPAGKDSFVIPEEWDTEQMLPDTWSDWKLEEIIGEHEPVMVYKAVRADETGTSYSAIKIIPVPKGVSKLRYIQEIKAMLSLKGHPNIVSIDDYACVYGEDCDLILIRMELLTPLDKAVAAEEFDERETARVGIEMCEALEECRSRNIFHLDVKPSNIFVTDDGHYKLGDFGISRFIDGMTLKVPERFTPDFTDPELYRFLMEEREEEQTTMPAGRIAKYDQYSLGLVLYWIRNHQRPPFLPDRTVTREERKKAFQRRMDGEALPPLEGTSAELSRIIFKADAYNPEDRYDSTAELKKDLEKLQAAKKTPGRSRKLICALTALAVALGGAAVWRATRPDSDDGGTAVVQDSGACGEDLRWEIAGEVLRISGTGGMYDYTTESKPPWEEYKDRIGRIVVGEGTSRIGRYAFFDCDRLVEVKLPNSLRRINSMAFGYCDRLPVLTIPEGVEYIEESIIYRCPSLGRVDLPGSLKLIEGSFAGECGSLAEITLGKGCTEYTLKDGVLFDAEMTELICHPAGLEGVRYVIPEKVRTIGTYAFDSSCGLTEIEIPEGLTTIDSCAFTGCRNLRSAYISDSVGILGNYAFYGCERLKDVRLPAHITWIDQQAFYNCYALQEIILPEGVTRIGTAVFGNCSSLQRIVIPASVDSISNSAFEQCPNVVIVCESGSYAEQYAAEHGIPSENRSTEQNV